MNCLTTLLPHQIPPVEKLLPIRVGALFMEMGTGKSRVALEFATRRQGHFDHVVWFCPVSLKETIFQEIRKHTDCPTEEIYIFDDHTNAKTMPKDRLFYIIGIESMSASNRAIIAASTLVTDQTFVIVDESSYIKGHWAKRTRRITAMCERARYRMVLTGTPLSQGVVDLYAQMRFLSPKILGYRSFYSFANNHLEYSKRIPGKIVRALNTGHLAKKLQPYVYQVTKEECLDLPDKLYEARWTSMSIAQQYWYQVVKNEFSERSSKETNFVRLSYMIFQLFTELQEVACGFLNQRENGKTVPVDIPSSRLGLLMETIQEIPEEAKIIIWSKFHYNTLQIFNSLNEQYSGQAAMIHGKINTRRREEEIARWREGGRFLVASPGVGGHGFNLTEARYVIFYSNGFKYSERLQAEDRCHRIGQQERVTYIDLAVNCGIEDRILKALAKKKNVVDDFRRQVEAVKDQKTALLEAVAGL